MQLDLWLTWYDMLRAKFGYSIVEDQSSAQLLSELLQERNLDPDHLKGLIANKNVIVVGAGPSLEESVKTIKSLKAFVIIAADGASEALIVNDIKPDIVVTDLDGSHEYLLRADKMGSIMVVHAHGDNTNLLRNLVPKLKNCIGTTQVKPLNNIHNFGGFTDGDRAVFLASEFKAKSIVLVGMDFGNRIGKYSKTHLKNEKLKVAKMETGKELLEWLAPFTNAKLYNASPSTIKGFRNIALNEIEGLD
ncbi:MAG: 6-hydroxymethylpterin diphosphokinase MptE-like protein [Nitrososphaerales archaeon]